MTVAVLGFETQKTRNMAGAKVKVECSDKKTDEVLYKREEKAAGRLEGRGSKPKDNSLTLRKKLKQPRGAKIGDDKKR